MVYKIDPDVLNVYFCFQFIREYFGPLLGQEILNEGEIDQHYRQQQYGEQSAQGIA